MKRYKYKMRHQWIAAPRIGEIRPIFSQEVTPGDSWFGRSVGVFRLAPLDVPTYMSLQVFVHFFFVRHSLTFPEFPEVITGEDTTTPWPVKQYQAVDALKWIHHGVGSNFNSTPDNNALPLYAFNQVINDYFKDKDTADRPLDSLDVARAVFPESQYHCGIKTEIEQSTDETVDSSGATILLRDIRDGLNRMRLKERRAEYGEKYVDLLASMGVQPRHAVLDRAEHCCRASTTIGISEVVATASSTSENTGDYRGHGISGIRINFPKRYFSEHGTLVGVMYARPRFQLRNKQDRIWSITDKEELYFPEHFSDTVQVVKASEIYNDIAVDTNFGYQAKYEHLRQANDVIAGAMAHSNRENWTAHVDLGAVPTPAFLRQVQDYDKIFQDQTASRADLHSFFDHRIGKRSIIKPRRK